MKSLHTRCSVVVIGSATMDLIVQLPRLPRPGETVPGGSFSTSPGGKGANQAVAAARAGAQVTFVGKVGPDPYGEENLDVYRSEGLAVGHTHRHATAPTGVGVIFVGMNGENAIGVALGANMELTPGDVMEAEQEIAGADVVLLQLEIPFETVECAIDIAHRLKKFIILNPAPARDVPRSILETCDVITPNESETQILCGVTPVDEPTCREAVVRLREKGARMIVLTLGARGAYADSGGEARMIAPFHVAAVDSTGAGDAFNGALAVALGEGMDLMSATRFANAAAAISVTRVGAQSAIPYRKAIDELLVRG